MPMWPCPRLIASRSDLELPRHWVHYSYFVDEERARSAAAAITAAGWHVQRVAAAKDGESSWIVVADAQAVTSPAAVREARQFFEGVAATHGVGEYDGWEAGVPSRPKEVPRLLRRPRRAR